MSGELTAESAMAVLEGKDGPAVAGLLEELRVRGQDGRPITLPPPEHEWLDGVGGVTDDVVVRFLDLLWEYLWFEPPLDQDDRRIESLEVLLRHGGPRAGFHLALLISVQAFPWTETDELMVTLQGRGVEGEREVEAAKWLVSCLLDHPETRSRTVNALAWMLDRPDLAPVARYVWPQLEPAEIAEVES